MSKIDDGGTMKDWKISMPDGWKPGENGEICSEACPFFYSYTRTGKQFCYPHKCPLASAVAVEPLAVLADRKGVSVEITPPSFYQTEGEGWEIGVAVPWEGMLYPFDSPTYAECEAKAREFLAGLPDKGEPK